jgi:segregation and condensation protein B
VLLAQVLERPRGEVAAGLRALAAEYTADGRGFDLREIAGGWRFYTREDCAPLVERFVRDGQEVRLTQAALETLAVIAYRQPVSRARVSAVRGVNCDGVIRTLVLRGLAEDSGTDPETGAILYRTTGYFLERLGMASLDELPDLAPFLPENTGMTGRSVAAGWPGEHGRSVAAKHSPITTTTRTTTGAISAVSGTTSPTCPAGSGCRRCSPRRAWAAAAAARS